MSGKTASVTDIERAVRGAYVEGYIQGSMHPKGERVIPKAHELARLFWRLIEDRNGLSPLFPRAARRSVSEGARDE